MNLDSAPGKELTLRGLLLGVALTLLFCAANIYLGLKIGLTFATSLPAAVISMAFLGLFSGSNVRENNIVQTVCSSAGAMASIIFVLPGLVIIGFWTGFPFWACFLLSLSGGVLGVMFTIPLRRALVTHSDLPYPEGVAGAEVLLVGAEARADKNPEAREGLIAIIHGSLASAGLSIAAALRVITDSAEGFFRLGAGASGYSFSFSLALLGAGHLVGISVGVAMLLGIAIAWVGAVPVLTALAPQQGELGEFVIGVWRTQVRFIGAGAMAVAAIWSLGRTIGPILAGLAQVAARKVTTVLDDQTDRDISMPVIIGLTAASLLVSTILVWHFATEAGLGGSALGIAVLSIPIMLLFGFLVAAICGYMAGLIGSSNSPISGVGILAVVGCSVFLLIFFAGSPDKALAAVALFITSILFAAACSSNDNLQDLKTGQLVGAAPWRQQVALLVGVAASALVIPHVLNLLAKAYGFAGAPGPHRENALPAPQAGLMAALAQGVLENNVDWSLIQIGIGIGVLMIIIDSILRRAVPGAHLSPLAVGLGMYLPTQSTLMVVVGSVVGWYFDRRADQRPNPNRIKQLGVLLASGLIVGEGLVGVVLAGIVAFSGKDFPLQLVSDSFADGGAMVAGSVGFALLVALMYRWCARLRE